MAITSRGELHDHARVYADAVACEVRAAVAAGEDEGEARRRLELAVGRMGASVVHAGGGDVTAFWVMWHDELTRTRVGRTREYGAALIAVLAALTALKRRVV